MRKFGIFVATLLVSSQMMAAGVQTSGNSVTVRPDGGQAKDCRVN